MILDSAVAPRYEREHAMFFVRSTLAALYPARAEVPGVADCGLDAFLARYRREAPLLLWLGVVAGSLIFTLSPIVTIGWPLPSFLLPSAALDRHANAAASHRWYLLRQLIMLPKMVAGMCWAQDPRVRALHGLAPYAPDPGTWRER